MTQDKDLVSWNVILSASLLFQPSPLHSILTSPYRLAMVEIPNHASRDQSKKRDDAHKFYRATHEGKRRKPGASLNDLPQKVHCLPNQRVNEKYQLTLTDKTRHVKSKAHDGYQTPPYQANKEEKRRHCTSIDPGAQQLCTCRALQPITCTYLNHVTLLDQ